MFGRVGLRAGAINWAEGDRSHPFPI